MVSLKQLFRMINYRRKTFLFSFFIIFAICCFLLFYMDLGQLQQQRQEEISNNYEDSIDNVIAPDRYQMIFQYVHREWDQVEYFRFIVEDQLFNHLPQSIECQISVLQNTIKVTISCNDREMLEDVSETLDKKILTILNDVDDGWKQYVSIMTEPALEAVTSESIEVTLAELSIVDIGALGIISNVLISLTIAMLAALVLTCTAENLDPTVRTIGYLKSVTNDASIYPITEQYGNAEMIALVNALKQDTITVFSNIEDSDTANMIVGKLIENMSESDQKNICVVNIQESDIHAEQMSSVTVVDKRALSAADCMSESFVESLMELKKTYRHIFVLPPSMESSAVTVALSKYVSVFIVVDWGSSKQDQLQYALNCLGNSAEPMSVVFTNYRVYLDQI